MYEGGTNILIFKNIESIKLGNLTSIAAETNKIEALEAFSRIWMPQIQNIRLCKVIFIQITATSLLSGT